MSARAELAGLCARVGAKVPLWTQGPGGNISIKDAAEDVAAGAGHQPGSASWLDAPRLWIKASGLRLDRVSADSGLALLDLAAFRQRLAPGVPIPQNIEAVYAAWLAEFSVPGFGRPSMETGFHALLPRRLVFHFHALGALLMAHHHALLPTTFASWLAENTRLAVTCLPACLPGWSLSQQVATHAAADVLLLRNHGVILQSDDDTILDEWQQLEARFCRDFGYEHLLNPELVPSVAGLAAPLKIYFPDSAVFLDRLQACLQPGAQRGTFVLSPLAWERDRDVAELWLASQLLHKLCPDLGELPPSIASSVAALPTEEWRRRMARQSA